MQSFLKTWITDAIRILNLPVIEIEAEQAEIFRLCVEDRYSKNGREWRLYNQLEESSSVVDSEGWKKIEGFLKEQESILFFEKEEESTMYSLPNGAVLTELLAECPGFEFYISNLDAEFLIAFADDNTLVGAGRAKAWIDELY